jgi:phage baseplate assembly protein W
LYEPLNKYSAEKIVKTIKQMIETWEPRIVVDNVDINTDETETTYIITLNYHIPELKDNDVYTIAMAK